MSFFPNSLPAYLPFLTTREAIIDKIYRIASGLDTSDATLFASGFTKDSTLILAGRELIGPEAQHVGCFSRIAPLTTTHNITNIRINILDGETEASLTATAFAQHYAPGKGLGEPMVGLLAGAFYYIDLVKDEDDLWKAVKFVMKPVWMEGDKSLLGTM